MLIALPFFKSPIRKRKRKGKKSDRGRGKGIAFVEGEGGTD